MMKQLGSIIVELHMSRKELPRDVEKVMTYNESIPNGILVDTTLGGNCSTCGPVASSGLIAMEYGGIPTLGIRYTVLNVKLQTALT